MASLDGLRLLVSVPILHSLLTEFSNVLYSSCSKGFLAIWARCTLSTQLRHMQAMVYSVH